MNQMNENMEKMKRQLSLRDIQHILKLSIPLVLIIVISITCKNDHQEKIEKEFFTNPILDEGPDPYVYLHSDGYYYVMVTQQNLLKLWKSRSFTDLEKAESKEIWYKPDSGSNSCCI